MDTSLEHKWYLHYVPQREPSKLLTSTPQRLTWPRLKRQERWIALLAYKRFFSLKWHYSKPSLSVDFESFLSHTRRLDFDTTVSKLPVGFFYRQFLIDSAFVNMSHRARMRAARCIVPTHFRCFTSQQCTDDHFAYYLFKIVFVLFIYSFITH